MSVFGFLTTATLAVLVVSPALSATLEPVHPVSRAEAARKVDWNNIPELAFECEDNSHLVVSHKDNSLLMNGERVGGISSSDAMYNPVVASDKFGNESIVVVILIQDIKGPPSGLTGGKPWELGDASGGMWYFFRGKQITKCLPD